MRTTIAAIALICFLPLGAQAQATAEPAATISGGNWSMNGRWVGNSEYGTVIADLPEVHVYSICRSKMVGQAGVGTEELRVYVDNQLLPDYSLDHGSCIIARGRKFALRYSGPEVRPEHLLNGRYVRLDEDALESVAYTRSSFWAMSWVRDETQHHAVILVKDVAGEYRICLDNTQATLQDGQPGFVTLRLSVDGQYVQSFGDTVGYRHQNCVDVSASNIHLELQTWSPYMAYYLVEGSLFRRVTP